MRRRDRERKGTGRDAESNCFVFSVRKCPLAERSLTPSREKKKNTSCSLRLAKKRERGAGGRERGRGYDSKAKEEMGKGMKGGG